MTDFLTSLSPIDPEHPAAQACEEYLRVAKRITKIPSRRLGYTEDEPGVRMYYYRVSGGVLEFEARDEGSSWSRRVTDFISDPADLQDMLGPLLHAAPPVNSPSGDATVVQFRAAH